MRVLIAWSNISGYAAACWRSLAAIPGVELQVVAFAPAAKAGATTVFASDLVVGLDAVLIDPSDHAAMDVALREREDADIATVTGWIHPSFVAMARRRRAAGRPTLMTLDQPWEGHMKQRLTCVRRRPHTQRMDRIITASAAAEQYALKLGATAARLERGLYAFDGTQFGAVAQQRNADDASASVGPGTDGGWPRRFLYVGRFVPVKGLGPLAQAYRSYRTRVTDPWPLRCCGRGPDGTQLEGLDGVELAGFVAPSDLPEEMARSGVFVFPSRYEPWGVALAEAMGSGLPAICSTACHAGRDLVRDFDTGLTFKTGDVASLTSALVWMHEHHAELPTMGRRAASIAASFTDRVWAKRWHAILAAVLVERGAAGP